MQRRTRFFAAAAWAVCVLFSGQSQAGDPVSVSPSPAAAPGPDQTGPSADDPAAAAFKRSLDLYAAGDLKGALDAMRESHRLSNRTELFYNIARIEEELDDCPASLADYSHYLEQVPDGRYRQPAEQARQKLAARCPAPAAVEPAPTVVTSAVQPPAATPEAPNTDARASQSEVASKPWTPPRFVGWAAIAVGAVAGAGAVYFTAQAVDARDRFQRKVDTFQPGHGPLDLSAQSEQHRDQKWATVLAVTGGALVAGGVVVVLLAPRTKTEPASTAGLYLTPGQLGASFARSF